MFAPRRAPRARLLHGMVLSCLLAGAPAAAQMEVRRPLPAGLDTLPLATAALDTLLVHQPLPPPGLVRSGWRAVAGGLEAAGVTLDATQVSDASVMRRSGAPAGRALRSLADLGATVELERLLGLRSTVLRVQFLSYAGANGSDLLGDVQGFSNIDAEPFRRVGELWLEHSAGEHARVRVGRMDANSEFAAVEHGGGFLSSAMALSPTLFTLPTYPEPAAGVMLAVRPARALDLAGAVFDGGRPETGGPRTRFEIVEAGARWTLPGDAAGRLGAGAWHHDADYAPVGQGTVGWYLVADQALDAPGEDEARPASGLFLRFGAADGRVAEYARHAAGGVHASRGLGGPRFADLGAGVTRLWGSAVGAGETVLEGYLALQATASLALVPDVQYLLGDGRDPGLAGSIRVVIAW